MEHPRDRAASPDDQRAGTSSVPSATVADPGTPKPAVVHEVFTPRTDEHPTSPGRPWS